MIIKARGYNVPEVGITTALTSATAAKVGTLDDYDKLVASIKKSGLARLQFELDEEDFNITATVNFGDDMFTLTTITILNSAPVVLVITVEKGEDGTYATPSAISLS